MLHTVLKGRDAGASFQLFLGDQIFFIIFQCHRTIEKLEKTALQMCLFDIMTNKEIFFYFLRVGEGVGLSPPWRLCLKILKNMLYNNTLKSRDAW